MLKIRTGINLKTSNGNNCARARAMRSFVLKENYANASMQISGISRCRELDLVLTLETIISRGSSTIPDP